MKRIFLMLVTALLVPACDSDESDETTPCESAGTCVADSCGDGKVSATETCDDSAGQPCTPPDYCESTSACFVATYSGSVETCDAVCTTQLIQECVSDDGCCPNGCNPENDLDCRPESCGNGVLDPLETCDDPQFPCPTECPNNDTCLTVTLTGLAAACNAACTSVSITSCYPNPDGCCPTDCGTDEDADCAANACGNAQLDPGEMCDAGLAWPASGACSPDCNDNRACTMDARAGDTQSCSVMCANVAQTTCQSDDGCCPSNCNVSNDTDCANIVCGDAVIDGKEQCDIAIPQDQPGSCPTQLNQCDDLDPCTTDTLVGNPNDCSAHCLNTPLPCGEGDACCPANCNATNDAECAALNLCDEYCDKALTYCTGINTLYDTTEACLSACQPMLVGKPTDATGNTLYCRIHHLVEATNDPDTHCFHAAQNPSEACID